MATLAAARDSGESHPTKAVDPLDVSRPELYRDDI